MNKRTKALQITPKTREKVWERDNGCCVICGSPGNPEAHYISRAHSGLGIEENIVTLCRRCHDDYDQTILRDQYRVIIAEYLRSQYPDWDENKLIFRKDG